MKDKKSLILIVCSLFGAFWRRWLGTSTKISRFFKILVLYVFCFICYFYLDLLDYSVKSWIVFAWVSTWFMLFWNMSHGDYFGVNDTSQDEARLKWVDWLLKKIYGEGNYYNFKGNVTGMFIRYTVPAVLCCLLMPHHWFCLGGLIAAFCYGLCGKLFPKKAYTEYAEYMTGALSFGLFFVCLL